MVCLASDEMGVKSRETPTWFWVVAVLAIIVGLIWWGNRPYSPSNEDLRGFVAGYEDGWRGACDAVFSEPVMYYADRAVSPGSCTALMEFPNAFNLSNSQQAELEMHMEYGDGDPREAGSDQGGEDAWDAFWGHVSYLCFDAAQTDCYDEADRWSSLMDDSYPAY